MRAKKHGSVPYPVCDSRVVFDIRLISVVCYVLYSVAGFST